MRDRGRGKFGLHPVYKFKANKSKLTKVSTYTSPPPAVVSDPVDYLPSKDNHLDLESIITKRLKKISDLKAELASIEKGSHHFKRWESWVQETISCCFAGDLINPTNQVIPASGEKRFEIIFDIVGKESPWEEIKNSRGTHRALIECKNTEEPTDDDFSKLERDMESLDLKVAFMAYRGKIREPSGKFLQYQRSRYINSKKQHIIVGLSEAFLFQCLNRGSSEKNRNNLLKLWTDHLTKWLVT